MLARIESYLRLWRRRISRSQLAIPLLGLPVPEGTGTEPGLILLQIDGLSRRQMEDAMARGRLPFLKGLVKRQHYETHTFYAGLPSTTPAVQAELHYGVKCAVPSFSFFNRSRKRVFTMFTPDCARQVQGTLEESGEGLLRGGSSWSNIYTGGASDDESHYCSASLTLGRLFGSRPVLRHLLLPILHLPSLLKVLALLGVEILLAFRDMCHGIRKGEGLLHEFKGVWKRAVTCVGLRELITIGVKIDAIRGLPVIHVNFLGYDDQAHRHGPSSRYAHWTLRGIDRACKNIYRAAQRSSRRDYQIWIFSDHGQEPTQPFDNSHPGRLEEVIKAAIHPRSENSDAGLPRPASRPRPGFTGGRSGSRGIEQWFREEVLSYFEEKPYLLTAMGPVGHLYLKENTDTAARRAIATSLVGNGGVPGVLLAGEGATVEWIHSRGTSILPEETPGFLEGSSAMRLELAGDLTRLARHRDAGDLVLLGWGPDNPPLTFAHERGGHAGPGPEETQGFALLPPGTALPEGCGEFVRPAALRAAAMTWLGHAPRVGRPEVQVPSVPVRGLRVMTYNVHGCIGMDGRTSPGRIARVIALHRPDLVALQELDCGRSRSNHQDQPRMIADLLGMQVAFCPTVILGEAQYGHALLSRFKLGVVRNRPFTPLGIQQVLEPRGAIWARIDLGGVEVQVMSTHLGLRRRERLAQVGELLGRDWIGAVGEAEPLILCGDFNFLPGSPGYRAFGGRLRDVQTLLEAFTPMKTFSTIHPVARIDHIFLSDHFLPTRILVPRTHLTRTASDHLPLLVELSIEVACCN